MAPEIALNGLEGQPAVPGDTPGRSPPVVGALESPENPHPNGLLLPKSFSVELLIVGHRRSPSFLRFPAAA